MYVLTARGTLRDVAANALDGDWNGSPGGDFRFEFRVVNDAPTTIGIPSVTVAEDQEDTAVGLFDAFSDSGDADSALAYSVTGTSNPGLFTNFAVEGDVLRLNYAPDANGESTITVRATDTGRGERLRARGRAAGVRARRVRKDRYRPRVRGAPPRNR